MKVRLFWVQGTVTEIDAKEYQRMIELGEFGECKRSFRYGGTWIDSYEKVDAHLPNENLSQ